MASVTSMPAIRFEPDELGRDFGESLLASLGPAIFDCDAAAIDPAEFSQPLHKRGDPLACNCRRGRAHGPNVGGDPGCCARAGNGQTAIAPLSSMMNSRRRMSCPLTRPTI